MCGKCRESDLIMKIKTPDLTGKALNYAVAVSEGFWPFTDGISWIIDCKGSYKTLPWYSTDWAVAGPILERERITLDYCCNQGDSRAALGYASYDNEGEYIEGSDHEQAGPTPLIAAMRCYVASKLGPEVEIPGELL